MTLNENDFISLKYCLSKKFSLNTKNLDKALFNTKKITFKYHLTSKNLMQLSFTINNNMKSCEFLSIIVQKVKTAIKEMMREISFKHRSCTFK